MGRLLGLICLSLYTVAWAYRLLSHTGFQVLLERAYAIDRPWRRYDNVRSRLRHWTLDCTGPDSDQQQQKFEIGRQALHLHQRVAAGTTRLPQIDLRRTDAVRTRFASIRMQIFIESLVLSVTTFRHGLHCLIFVQRRSTKIILRVV